MRSRIVFGLIGIIAMVGAGCTQSEPTSTPALVPEASPTISLVSTPTIAPEPAATTSPVPRATLTPTFTPVPTLTPPIVTTVTSPSEPSSTPTPTLTPTGRPDLIPREVLFTLADKLDVQLSPDGTRISYKAPVCDSSRCVMNVWAGDFAYPSAAEPVTRDMTNGVQDYAWAYTNGHILYTQDTDGDEEWRIYSVDINTGRTTRLTPLEGVKAYFSGISPRFPQEILIELNDRDPSLHDLYRIDIRTGERALVRKNEGFLGFITDQDFNVRFAMRFTEDGGSELLSPTAEGGWELFSKFGIEDSLLTWPLGFDRTGKSLYMSDSRDRNTAAVVRVDLDTGDRFLIAEDPQADLSDAIVHPLTGEPQAAAFTFERKHWQIIDHSIADDLAYLQTVADGEIEVVSQSLDNRRWIVLYTIDSGPGQYYSYDRDTRTARFLFTDVTTIEELSLAKMHPVVIKSRDGLNLVSYLTLPTWTDADGNGRPEGPLPMVLLVHGGPWDRDEWGYNPEHQWLANRGYAVLSVNFRGSTGFGKEFINAAIKEYAGKMHDDLIDAVSWAVEEQVADPKLVAIMGGSYGGYATLVGLTFTPDTFACGAEFAGPSNLITDLEANPPHLAWAVELFATRVGDHRTEEGRAFLLERSPLSYVDRIKRPLLIGHGANDPRVKQAESRQIVQAMQDRGRQVTYLLYPDEGHGFSSVNNTQSFNAIAEAFLAQCLEGRYEPFGTVFRDSSITVPVGAGNIPGLAAVLTETQLRPTRTTIETPFGPMQVYESATSTLSIQYPAGCTQQPELKQLGVTAQFAGPNGEQFVITEEDTGALSIGGVTLARYVDLVLSVVESSAPGFELVSREQTVTTHGLTAEVLIMSVLNGVIKTKRFIVLHDRISFSASYVAPKTIFLELEPLIDYSFGTFRVEGLEPPAEVSIDSCSWQSGESGGSHDGAPVSPL